jgi:DNA-binding MarR family transcriptional regulator
MENGSQSIETLSSQQRSREMLLSLRKIIQAISLNSKDLSRRYGLTGPQLIILNEIANHDLISVTELARSISLSQATVTDILNRLEKRNLIERIRDSIDRRRVQIRITEQCQKILSQVPPPLQETFIERYAKLSEWEQLMILTSFKRVVDLVSANKISVEPFLTTDPL